MSESKQHNIRRLVVGVIGGVSATLFGLLTVLKIVVDNIGRTTVLDDAQTLLDRFPAALVWLSGASSWFALLVLLLPAAVSLYIGMPAIHEVVRITAKGSGETEAVSDPNAKAERAAKFRTAREKASSLRYSLEKALARDYSAQDEINAMRAEIFSGMVTIKKPGIQLPDFEKMDLWEARSLLAILKELMPFLNDRNYDEAVVRSKEIATLTNEKIKQRKDQISISAQTKASDSQ